MKLDFAEEIEYKKGKLYSPDEVNELPQSCNKYFEDYELSFGKQHEMGTVKCIRGFKISVKVYVH